MTALSDMTKLQAGKEHKTTPNRRVFRIPQDITSAISICKHLAGTTFTSVATLLACFDSLFARKPKN